MTAKPITNLERKNRGDMGCADNQSKKPATWEKETTNTNQWVAIIRR